MRKTLIQVTFFWGVAAALMFTVGFWWGLLGGIGAGVVWAIFEIAYTEMRERRRLRRQLEQDTMGVSIHRSHRGRHRHHTRLFRRVNP